MNFEKKTTPIHGCFELQPVVRKDARGSFVKVFHAPEFKKLGLETDFREEYYSVSRKGVLRGLHFQEPPAALIKLVFCIEGEVLDAVLDLRRKSRTCGKAFTLKLSAGKANMLYIPEGCAHGFYTLSSRAVMVYRTSAVYSPVNDKGVLWSSAGIKWPSRRPLLSPRDAGFPELRDYASPF
ncbi:MAG: dTDP-4-dehydrorhamnose 3,5-epimerase family protein [Elusimicrobia bacterium]|nr:dTDP-4-dehydrorhamnose 3,5-epimerase family protein [Elusimicrobiota bacterium]